MPRLYNYPKVTRRTYKTTDGVEHKSAILEHNVFLFQNRPRHFSYQHNSRGMQDFFAGTYNLAKVDQYYKVAGLLMLEAAIKGVEAVAWLEHTSNWDGFVQFTSEGKVWTTTWGDFSLWSGDKKLDPMDPPTEFFAVDSEAWFEGIVLKLDGGYLPDEPTEGEEFADWDDEKTATLDLHTVTELHVWFDT